MGWCCFALFLMVVLEKVIRDFVFRGEYGKEKSGETKDSQA